MIATNGEILFVGTAESEHVEMFLKLYGGSGNERKRSRSVRSRRS